jgi:hypothetical protein
MRVCRPNVSLSADEARLEAALVPDGPGSSPFVVELGVPRHLLGWLDMTANPFVPIATVAAGWTGEDVLVEGPVSSRLLAGAGAAAAILAGWFDRPAPAVSGPEASDATAPPGPSRGLFFTRGVDSWATRLRPGGEGARATHLLVIDGIDRAHSADTRAQAWADHQRVADALGLPLVRLTTNARQLLDPLAEWDWTHGSVLAAFGLALGPLLGRVVIASSYRAQDHVRWGSHADLDPRWSTESTTFVHADDDLGRWEKTELVATDDLALGSLKVCWIADTAANCGRCPKCLRTMTTLDALGALERCDRFEEPLTADAIRSLDGREPQPFVDELLEHLEPGSGPLRRAWEEVLGDRAPRRPWPVADPGSSPVAGPALLDRLDAALAGVGLRPVVEAAGGRRLGWEPGMVPLRPAAGDLDAVADRLGANPGREVPWAVAEPYPADRPLDPGRLVAADAAQRAWGPGIAYLPGIPWATDERPVLGAAVVARMLDRSRVRLWWRDDGTLDPLRVVESVERGCLPLQVMPAGAAAALRRRLPPAMADLVVGADDLAALSPAAVTARLAACADLVLAGSIERDLAPTGALARHG